MGKFRKKPVVIEAFQWTGDRDQNDDPEWIVEAIKAGDVTFGQCLSYPPKPFMSIRTLEGLMTASIGDWIIKGIEGEIYPCKPEIFEKSYEPAIGHSYWRAGDPACPSDIKAPNGELHTLRCKLCGLDDPKDSDCHQPVKKWLDGDERRTGFVKP